MPSNDHCVECGMVNVGGEYHPAVLCRLVQVRGGDTAKARSDLAAVLDAGRSDDRWLSGRVDTFLANVAKGTRNRKKVARG
jgi:hypothetical protein